MVKELPKYYRYDNPTQEVVNRILAKGYKLFCIVPLISTEQRKSPLEPVYTNTSLSYHFVLKEEE